MGRGFRQTSEIRAGLFYFYACQPKNSTSGRKIIMARPFRIYEQLLAEQAQGGAKNQSKGRHKRIAASRARSKKQPASAPEEKNFEITLPDEFVTKRGLRKIAMEHGIPFPAIQDLIDRGLLKPILFNGYSFRKYHAKRLEYLLRNYNTI